MLRWVERANFLFSGQKAAATTEARGDAVIQNMRNKTMEEIINKWTGELDRCSEQFKEQATNIRRWDSILVDNGDKVSTRPTPHPKQPTPHL